MTLLIVSVGVIVVLDPEVDTAKAKIRYFTNAKREWCGLGSQDFSGFSQASPTILCITYSYTAHFVGTPYWRLFAVATVYLYFIWN